ncbi:MAG TPA: sugar kinase [Mesotoga sp.]|nr:sugar kinase [Mesotoga sp.]
MKPEVLSFGEPLAAFYSKDRRSLSEAGEFYMTWGGDTSNVALGISKLGHTSGYITKVGNDAFGEGFLNLWKSNGVDTSSVIIDSDRLTGMYFASFTGEKHEFIYRRKDAAASTYSVDDASKVDFEGIKILHLSGVSQAISRQCLEASFTLMNRARENGAVISFDLNYRSKLWSRDLAKSIYLSVISNYADIVSLNDDEQEILGMEGNPEDAANSLLELGPKIVALRCGVNGAIIATRKRSVKGKAKKVEVADTVGAGDTFTASLLCCYLEDRDVEDSLQFALSAAALTCTKTGSTEGQPSRKQVLDLLGGNPVTQ